MNNIDELDNELHILTSDDDSRESELLKWHKFTKDRYCLNQLKLGEAYLMPCHDNSEVLSIAISCLIDEQDHIFTEVEKSMELKLIMDMEIAKRLTNDNSDLVDPEDNMAPDFEIVYGSVSDKSGLMIRVDKYVDYVLGKDLSVSEAQIVLKPIIINGNDRVKNYIEESLAVYAQKKALDSHIASNCETSIQILNF